jgi:SNF2 family DNA or RNA helicase
MGKTSITLKAFDVLRQEGMVKRMLVIAPLRPCYLVWPAEIDEWQNFSHLRYSILHGGQRQMQTALEQDADVYIINPEGLPWLMSEGRLKQLGAQVLTIDESSKFRHCNTRRFKLLKPALKTFDWRWILTGSPNSNGYLDLFGQVYLLDLGAALGQYITHYRQQYFYPTGYGGYTWKLQDGAEERIHKVLKPLVLRLDAEDYLKVPKPEPNIIRVDLSANARKVYDELEEDMITELRSGAIVTATNSGSALNKCCQVASGALYHMLDPTQPVFCGKRKWELVHNAKLEALQDLIDELQGSPLLLAYEYNHDLERILKLLQGHKKEPVPYLGSGVSMPESMAIEKLWNTDQIAVLPGHPQSMGHGLNLQHGTCHHVAFFTMTWDFELYDQFIQRVRRQGNKNKVVWVHHFVARRTVDEVKLRRLHSKNKTQRGLLDALREYAKGR